MPRQGCHSSFGERLFVAFQASNGRADLGPANVSDASASLLDQMRRCEHPNRLVVYAYKVRFEARKLAIQKYIGNFLRLDLPKALNRPLRRSNQHYVHTPGKQLGNLFLFQTRILIGRRNEKAISLASYLDRDRLGNLRKERVE